MSEADPSLFERCMAAGGIAVFPSDTVYGLACDPTNRIAVERLYAMKGRPLAKPSAVMFFDLGLALDGLVELGPRTRDALSALLPGQVSLLLPNPAGRFPLACGEDPGTLGVRVPRVPLLSDVRWPVLQSSANHAGGPDPRRLSEVPEGLRAQADLVIDGGELPGTPSTVVDLRRYEAGREWSAVRLGAVSEQELSEMLGGQFHFDPATYGETIRAEVPAYDRFQDSLVEATGDGAQMILELGTGTGETALRLLRRHLDSTLVGVDVSESMLAVARRVLPAGRVSLRVARLQDPLPDGPFDLVASALSVHHLSAPEKAELFARIAKVLATGGRFVLGDVIAPRDPADATIPLTPGYDQPSPLEEQLRWLMQAGFDARVYWCSGDLAVMQADLVGRHGR